jgi:hypothetical protein
VRYKGEIVLHDSPLSSIFLIRALATASEMALIYQLAYLLRTLNAAKASWVDIVSWGMVAQVMISQLFVWGAILTGRPRLYFCEELGWGLIYGANTVASAYLCAAGECSGGSAFLLRLNLLFGAVYLPWQVIHLRAIRRYAGREEGTIRPLTWDALTRGLRRAIRERNPSVEAGAWGGLVGVIWMAAYWATLLPMWVYQIARRI